MRTTSFLEDIHHLVTGSGTPACPDVDSIAPESSRDVISLGNRLGRDLHQALALAIKWDWERQLDKERRHQTGMRLAMKGPAMGALDTVFCKAGFTLDANQLFQTFQDHGHWAHRSGYSSLTFGVLVKEMVLLELYAFSNDSRELEDYIQRQTRSLELLDSRTEGEKAAYWTAKEDFIDCSKRLDEPLMSVERYRVRNANIRWQWMKTFGKSYFELKKQSIRFENAKMRMDLLEINPQLTYAELVQLASESEAEKEKALNALSREVLSAPGFEKTILMDDAGETDFIKHQQNLKTIFRKIFLLIHPDRLCTNPMYENLTASQKKRLEHLWHEVMRVKDLEIGFEERQIGYQVRNVTCLLDALLMAEKILKNAGIDTRVHLIIGGDTYEEQLAWLKDAIARVDREIEAAQAELLALLKDEDIQEKSAMNRASGQQQEAIKAEMRSRAGKFKTQAKELELQLESYFFKGAA